MAFHNDLGKFGEELATEFLIKKGYSILDRNWRSGNLEIDIIAATRTEIIFVEVKTRSDDTFMNPEDAVNWQKQRNITIAANHYIHYKKINLEPRFDVISIIINKSRKEITHHEDAFLPVSRRRRF